MKLPSTLFALTITVLSCAQTIDKKKLDTYFDALDQSNKFMGSVALSQNGKLLYSRAVGYRNVAQNSKATRNTLYRIGSISKTFTAVLVMKGVEEKKLRLEQTLDQFYPNIPNAGKITIQNLLEHRSGLHNITDDQVYQSYYQQPQTEQEMVERITRAGTDFQPGTEAKYSNSNYILLTYILQKVYKDSYSNLLAKYITKPLELKNTFFGDVPAHLAAQRSQSYGYFGGWEVQPVTDSSVPMGAGGIWSTAEDLVRFSDGLFGGKLLRPASLEVMKTMKDHYGRGLFQFPFGQELGYGHTGGIDGFTSIFTYFPSKKISYAQISNGSNYDTNKISIAVLSAANGLPYDIPTFKKLTVAPEMLEQYVGVYSSTELPLKITVTRKDNQLLAQATGQAAINLEYTGNDTFTYDGAGIEMIFKPKESMMLLKQAGQEFHYKK